MQFEKWQILEKWNAGVIRAVRLKDSLRIPPLVWCCSRSRGPVFAELMVCAWACWQHCILDSHRWNKLENAPMHIAMYSAISVNEAGAQCVKILIRLSCLHVNHQPRQILYSMKPGSFGLRLVADQRCAMWSTFTPGCGSFFNSLAVQHANNCDQFKPHRFIRHPGLTISTPMACLAAVRLREMGTNVLCLCVWERERNGERDRKKAEEERKEEGRHRPTGQQGEMWWQHVSFR